MNFPPAPSSPPSSFPRRRESLLALAFSPGCDGKGKSDDQPSAVAKRPRFRGNDGFIFRILRALLLLTLFFASTALHAQTADPAPLQFRDAAEEARFHALAAELRCVKCQNQSLADSNAQIAHDLRREVLALMHEGRSDAQIKQFLVERYGEFVLYKPPVAGRTWLLWFGPLLLLALGAGVVFWIVRRRSASPVSADEEQEW